MNIRIVKVDVEPIRQELARIADLLEQLVYTTNPPAEMYEYKDDKPENYVVYTDDEREIVAHKLAQRGKVYREKR